MIVLYPPLAVSYLSIVLDTICLSSQLTAKEEADKEKMQKTYRPDREGPNRTEFEKNKKKILMSQSVCGICGKYVDKSLKFPDPMSAAIDHIIPINRGGDPSNINNLQLTHLYCNRQKSDKIIADRSAASTTNVFNNRDLPLSIDWAKYRSDAVTGE